MLLRRAIVVVLLALPGFLSAEEPSLGPAIEGYGPTFPIDDRDVPLEEGAVYRAVFDAAANPDDPAAVNTRLVSIARFLNMHVRNGTPPEDMEVAVVVHGAALRAVLNNAAYRKRFGIDNPSLELVSKLHDAGVDVYVCGQSMAFSGIQKRELSRPAEVALSAMTMLTVLQNDGYALIP